MPIYWRGLCAIRTDEALVTGMETSQTNIDTQKEKEALLAAAIDFATKAHAGQTDKAGKPYITHPQRVMAHVSTIEEKITAILHDVLEDTDYTVGDLEKELHLPDSIRTALLLLTRTSDVDYMDYVKKLSANPLAAAVKRADLHDNMDLSRLPGITPRDLARQEKYKRALALLDSADA